VVAASRRGGPNVTVGIQGTEAAEQVHEGSITNLVLAVIHEFGAPKAGIPSRSFVRSTADENKTKYQRMLRKAGREVLKGVPIAQSLFVVGEKARADMVKKIQSNIPPALAASTVSQKKDTLALIDTGELLNAISSVVHT
jgi:hypothetical protein